MPTLAPAQLRQVGGGAAVEGSAIALVGPGTGLGVSGLVFPPGASHGVPLSGEGGHVTLAAQTQRSARDNDIAATTQARALATALETLLAVLEDYTGAPPPA